MVKTEIPNLVQGVSQQVDSLKLPGQVRDQENMFPSTVEGLRKRHHTDHVAQVAPLNLDRVMFHPIDRDSREQYLLTMSHQTLTVNSVAGEGISIFGGVETLKSRANPRTSDWTRTAQVGILSGQAKPNAAEDPDGGMEAFLLEREAGLGTSNILQGVNADKFTNGGLGLAEVRVKRSTGTEDIGLGVGYSNGTVNHFVRVDQDNCSLVSSTGVVRSHVEDLGDGWCLVRFVFTINKALLVGTDLDIQLSTAFGSGFAVSSNAGGNFWHKPKLVDLTASYEYLDIREPNRISASDAENLTNAGWLLTAQALTTQNTSVPSPLAIGTYDRVRRQSSAGSSTGGVELVVGTWERGRQTFSVFTKKEGVSSDASMVRIELRDSTGTSANHFVEATWSGTVLGSPVCSDNAYCGIEDFGNGHYRLWVSVATADTPNTVQGDVRKVVCFAKDDDLGPEVTALFAQAKVEVGVIAPTPYMDPERRLRALTVADYTFLGNGLKKVEMLEDKTDENPNVDEAFLFIQQGDLNTFYRAKVKVNGSNYIRSILTWPGSGSSNREIHHLDTIGAAAAGVWNLEVGSGPTVVGTYTASGADTAEDIAEELAKAANAYSGSNAVTVNVLGDALEVTGRVRAALAPVNLRNPSAALVGFTETTDSTSAAQFAESDQIAALLAGRLQAIPEFEVTASGSVVRIVSSDEIEELILEDSNGDRNTARVWKEIDNFDELPLTCRDGFSVKVTGIPEERVDDYWVKFEADKADDFGPGVWRESTEPGITFRLDPDTLPHALVRREDDSSGTITGRPFELFFDHVQPEWSERLVGDLKTNKEPSFVDEHIRGLFLWQGRLGFLAGQSMVMSETSRFFNFFRTTVLDLPASERIDLISGHSEISLFNHAQVIDEELMLFTDRTQFVVTGDPLTPETAALVPKLSEESLVGPMPVSTGSTILMASQTGEHSSVHEILRLGDQEFDAADVTLAVTKYIPGSIVSMSTSRAEDVAAFLTDGDRGSLYINKYQWVGQQKIQSAWSRYSFGTNTRVLGHSFIRSDLYILLERNGATWLERMEVSDGLGFNLLLDRRVGSDDPRVSVALVGSDTEWTLPYDLDPAETHEVWFTTGIPRAVIQVGSNTIRVAGDQTGTPVVIGQRYTASVELPRPVIPRGDSGHGIPRLGSKLNTISALIESQDGTAYDISIDRGAGRSTESYMATVTSPGVYNAMITMPQDSFTLTLSNPYAGSVGFVKVEYENEYDAMSGYL